MAIILALALPTLAALFFALLLVDVRSSNRTLTIADRVLIASLYTGIILMVVSGVLLWSLL